MAASNTVPTASENTTSILAMGRPTPRFWLDCCGYSAWFSGVSGMVKVEPSAHSTRCPSQRHSAEALRQKHPHGDGGRVDPSLPKRPCLADGFQDTIFREQTGEVQVTMPASLRYGMTERGIQHFGLLAFGCFVYTAHLDKRGRFLSISIAPQRLTKVQVPFVPDTFSYFMRSAKPPRRGLYHSPLTP